MILLQEDLVGEREISTEGVDPDRVKGSSRKSTTRDDGRNSRKQAAAAVSRRSVDRSGRPIDGFGQKTAAPQIAEQRV